MPGFPFESVPDPISGSPSDLPSAIVDLFNATTSLDWITGGITYGTAQTDSELYVEFHPISDQFQWTTCSNYVKQEVYQFNCYGPTEDDAELMLEGLISTFNHKMTRLTFTGGTSTMANPGSRMRDPEEYPSALGHRLRRMHADFTFTVNRSLT